MMDVPADIETIFAQYPKTISLTDDRSVRVRPLYPEDADALVRLFENVRDADLRVLHDDVTDERVVRGWATDVDYERVLPLVAEVEGEIVADATLHRRAAAPYEGIGEIRLYVKEGYRQRGLGDALLSELMELARAVGIKKVVMEFYVDHSELIAAFERRGFTREAILPTFQLVVLSYDLTQDDAGTEPDTVHADKLPPPDLWPDRVYPSDVLREYPDQLNLSEVLLDSALERELGAHPAIFFGDEVITYELLHAEVCRLANGLVELGLEEGEPAVIFAPNVPQAVAANLAVQRAGGVSVPAPPQLSRRELAYIVRDTEAEMVITTDDLLPELLAARSVTNIGPIVVIGDPPDDDGLYRYADLVANGAPTFAPVRRHRTDISLLLYTYRDDGEPKGTAHFNEAPLIAADLLGEYVWEVNEDDVLAAMTPVGLARGYVTFGVLPYRFGAASVLVPDPTPQAIVDAIHSYHVTVLSMTPTYYREILAEPALHDADLSSLRLCASAGEALTTDTYHAWNDQYGLPIFEGFGTTEMLSIFISNGARISPQPGSLGKPVPGYNIKVVNEQGRELPPGEIGHLIVQGPTGTLYWKDAEAQEEVMWHGWNHVGDYGYYDEDGYFWHVARQDDTIKSGGHRIDPMEVEASLREHPSVADAAVIGLPDKIKGQRLHAFLVPKPGVRADESLAEGVLDGLDGRLASYKIPTSVAFIEALPRNGSGKLLRRLLRERMRYDHGTE